MIVAQALEQLGVDANKVEGDLVIVRFNKGKPLHYTYNEVASKELDADTYIASGTFNSGTITRNGGRTSANVNSVLWLVLDCDLKDYTGESVEKLRTWSDGELMNACRALAQDLREVL